jgi:virginiamycin B lyase
MWTAAAALAFLPALLLAATATAEDPPARDAPVVQEWKVDYGGRPRDPYVGPDGKVWFVGQAGNYIAYFDPANESFRRYEIEDDTNPHTLIVDRDGFVWYAGNRNARIGKLDPKTGEVRLVTPHDSPSRPYGIVMDARGNPWVALLNTNQVVRIDPETFALTHYRQATPESRSRRLEITADGAVWYGDEPRGYLGRIDPASGAVEEYALPGGAGSRPYALTRDGDGRLWVSQSGPDKMLAAFDPTRRRFVAVHEVSATIRHMMFDPKTGAMWFGTDANQIGRVLTRRAAP